MSRKHSLRKRHGGAVAIVMGVSAAALFGFIGVALDLGRTYTVKTELQNAADAGALAGAKELDETAGGIALAFSKAKEYAAKNRFNFASADVVVPDANIQFGPSPDGPWFSKAQATAAPNGLTFIKVDTGGRTLNTLLMRAANPGATTTGTFGSAVAGRYVNDVTPIGVCAIDPDNKTARYSYPDGNTELLELGFRRGVGYDLIALNPLGGSSGTPFLINPVDAPPATCEPSHSSADFTAPFVCKGSSAVVKSLPASVYVNTGYSAGKIEKALNSRFDLPASSDPDKYGGGSPCDPKSAPPDANVKQYVYDGSTNGDPRFWMEPGGTALPDRQSVEVDPTSRRPTYLLPPASTTPNLAFGKYGALWSYGPAYQASSGTPPKAGSPYAATNGNWQRLYGNGAGSLLNEGGYPAGAPYGQASGDFFEPPGATHPGRRNRRILHVVILDCGGLGGSTGLSCATLPVKGIGKFFMQVRADLTGNPKRIETEFAGLIEPVPVAEIKLYR